MSEFLELTPVEYATPEWRKCSPFVAHLKSTRGDLPPFDKLSAPEELTVRFGFWCYRAGWGNGLNLIVGGTDVEGEPWTCYECGGVDRVEHPRAWKYCPFTGITRHDASKPSPEGCPRSWRDNPAGWMKFKGELDRLGNEELQLAGLSRKPEEPDGD